MSNFKEKLAINMGLFWDFFWISCGTFGGGLSMLAHFQTLFVEEKQWITEEELLEIISIAQCTPGAIATNISTFIGFKRNRVVGALFATCGLIAPSVLIIVAISIFLPHFLHLPLVASALNGIKIMTLAMISGSWWKLRRKVQLPLWGLIPLAGVVIYFHLPIYLLIGVVVVLSLVWRFEVPQ